ncbi:MAG: HD domain-containing protein [Pseudoruegeria sp.]
MAEYEPLRASLRRIAETEMVQDSAHDLAHLDRVWLSCQHISQGERAGNPRVLLAGSYLHDLINIPKNSENRAHASSLSAEAAALHLDSLGYDESEIQATQHAIEAHSFSAGILPRSIDALILRDADRLDALGAVGIARTFSVAGAMRRTLYHPEDPFACSRDLDDYKYSIDHWKVKLLVLAQGLATPTGQAIGQVRVQRMVSFLEGFAEEIGCELPDAWRQD